MSIKRVGFPLALAVVSVTIVAAPSLRAASEAINYADIDKIKAEGLQRSQVMQLCSWLTDVYGPRLTGSPMASKAAEWAVATMRGWGLARVEIEPWANRNGFDRGWSNDRFYMAFSSPDGTFAIPGTPTAWTPGTHGLATGSAVLVTATTEADMEQYKGKLKGTWVLTQPPADVAAYWDPPAKRFTPEELATMESATPPRPEFGTTPQVRPAPPAAQAGQRANPPMMTRAARSAFFRAEGALGTISMAPRGHGIYTTSGNRAADPATTLPAVVVPAEHYGRIARLTAKQIPVVIEADIENSFYPNPAVFNIVGEIPGTDKADEVVMLGGHFDSWHAATGATDNGVGVAAMMEAMRILNATGVRLRRTVRIGLWGGEEQGLLGSREYVAAHLAAGGPQGPLAYRPEYDKFSAYFNIDNGTGALRGLYLQGNDAVAPIFRGWIEVFRSLGMTTLTIRNTRGTDHESFDSVGLPGFQFIQDEVEYAAITHHTNLDTYERLQPSDVMKMATIAAGFAYLAANRDEKLPRKPLPAAAQGGRGRRPQR